MFALEGLPCRRRRQSQSWLRRRASRRRCRRRERGRQFDAGAAGDGKDRANPCSRASGRSKAVASKNSVKNPKTYVTRNLHNDGRKDEMFLDSPFSSQVRSNCNSPIQMVLASLMRHSDRSLNLTDPLNQIERIVSCRFVGNPGGRWNLFATKFVFRRKGFIEESIGPASRLV